MLEETWGPHGRYSLEEYVEKFKSNISVDSATGCWNWTGQKHSSGRYGQASFQGRKWLAHRLAWALLVDKYLDDDEQVLHSFDNGFCVNPDHLFTGDHTDNMRDMEIKGRSYHKAGAAHGRAKLTWDDVERIRKLHAEGMSIRAITKLYPVSKPSIARIVHNKGWLPNNFSS